MSKFLTLFLFVLITNLAFAQSDSGNLDKFLQDAVQAMPGNSGNDYQEPAEKDLKTWDTLLNALFARDITQARTRADSLNYQVIRFMDTTFAKNKDYFILKEQQPAKNHWGLYVWNPDPCREKLILQAPHPKFDLNTGDQAAFCFKRLNARALFLSGTHRCNHDTASTCSGKTGVCSNSKEAYRISDMAHNTQSIYQQSTQNFNQTYDSGVFVQLHGFAKDANDPYVILSNGTRDEPANDYAGRIKSALQQADTSLTFKMGHRDTAWDRLLGFTNVQGRLINGSPDPCNQNAQSSEGRFVHIEQEKSKLRADSMAWSTMYQALSNVFECSSNPQAIHPEKDNSFVIIYPNPTNGSVNIKARQLQSVKVYDNYGRLVKRYKFEKTDHRHINLPSLPGGVYFLRLTQNHQTTTKTIVVK